MSASETKETAASPPLPSSVGESTTSSKSKEKRVKKKKKRVSKHVLKSRKEADEKSSPQESLPLSSKKNSTTSTPADAPTVKDPSEASNYLKAWETKEGWKFNKNTQSWLLRHMYEADKVSKNTFNTLLDYLKGLQGKNARKRVLEEATARAQRYRDYEKNKETTDTPANSEKKVDEQAIDETSKKTSGNSDNGQFGLEYWKGLDDHDKRKEYKRARRVLETLTAATD